jgi:hypothetical protein
VRKGRAAWRTQTAGLITTYDEDGTVLAGYDGPSRPSTLAAFWAEHGRHDVRYGRDDLNVVAQAECRDCPGSFYFLSLIERLDSQIDKAGAGIFFSVREE